MTTSRRSQFIATFLIASGICIVLDAASYWEWVWYQQDSQTHSWCVQLLDGNVSLFRDLRRYTKPPPGLGHRSPTGDPSTNLEFPHFGFGPEGRVIFTIPMYVPVLFLLLLAGFLRRSQIRSRNPPACHRCHYNLTGNTSGICPECGTSVKAADAAPEFVP